MISFKLLTRAGYSRKWVVLAGLALSVALLASLPKAVDYLINQVDADTFGQPHAQMPSLDGAVAWLNSPPLTAAGLKGKVVLVDFWTYDCINCRRSLPYVNAWAKQYAKDGLVVIGVHTPENDYEKIPDNVRSQVKKLGIDYPVAIDNNYKIWRAFDNQYWPAHYFFDASGKVRYSHFGEGRYEAQEKVIQTLLEEAKANHL
jgi:thiol-disulfide isomerase/thioredoxin